MMNFKFRKISGILFSLIFILFIYLPLLFTNTVSNFKSEFDNRVLPEFPSKIDKKVFSKFEDFINFRIGFREPALTAYQILNYKLFSIVEHPHYMRGEQSYLFAKGKQYTVDFQRLNVDEAYLDRYIAYLESINTLCAERNTKFLYFLVPDKQAIYPEFFPKGFNIKETKSRTEVFLEKLDTADFDYLFPKEEFLVRKQSQQIYNVEYDAGHWNGNGELLANQLVLSRLKESFPDIVIPSVEDYEFSMVLMTSLQTSRFPINEFVPNYELNETKATANESRFESVNLVAKNRYKYHFQNSNSATPLKLLLFGDSYMQNSTKHYLNSFSEVTFLHADNLPLLSYYIDEFQTDILVLEHAVTSLGPGGRFGDKLINGDGLMEDE